MVGARQLLHHHQRENNLQFLLDEIIFKNIFSCCPLRCCVTSNWFDGCDSNFVDAENIKTYSLQSKFVLTFLGDTNFKTSLGDGKGESLFS